MSSIIRGDEAGEVQRWQFPEMGDPARRQVEEPEEEPEPEEPEPEPDPWPTTEELEAIKEEARLQGYQAGFDEGRAAGEAEGREAGHAAGLEAGHAEGHAAGLEAGRTEAEEERQALAARAEALAAILETLAHPLEQLDEMVEEQLLAVINAAARQLVRRELHTRPDEIVAVVREAVAELPARTVEYDLHLHPEDAVIVREALGLTDDDDRSWRLVEDPGLTRGGCRVNSDFTTVDATLERRLAALSARLLGGERGDESESGSDT